MRLVGLAVAVAIEEHVDLDARNAGLPVLGGGVARIVFGARDRVVDDAGDAAVLVDRVRRLAPLDVVGLAEEGLHRLEQDRA